MKKLHSKSAVSSEQLAVSSRQSAGKTNSFLPTAICQLLTISVFLLTANCLLPTSSNAMGTNAGTEILNTPTAVTLNYSNATGTGTVTRNSDNSVTSSVTAVYGLVPVLSNQNLSTEAGVSTNPNFVYTVTASNAPVSINANNGGFSLVGPFPGDVSDWQSRFGSNVSKVEEWSTQNANLVSDLTISSVVYQNNHIYLIGGENNSGTTASVYVATINAAGDVVNWATATYDLPIILNSHCSIIYNDRIYTIGGATYNGNPTGNVYTTQVNADGTITPWATATPLPQPRRTFSCNLYNGRIYVFGGYDDLANKTNTIYYSRINADGSLSDWITNSNNIPSARIAHSTTVYNGRVYLIAGQAGSILSSVDYAPFNADGSIGAFVSTTALPVQTSGHRSIAHDQHLFVLGGSLGSNRYQSVYSVTINADGSIASPWTLQASTLPQKSEGFGLIQRDGYFYILGGVNQSGQILNNVFRGTLIETRSPNQVQDTGVEFNFYTTPSSYAFNNSQGLVTLNYFLSSDIPTSRIGNYTGFNSTSYGGSARLSPLTTTSVVGPDLVFMSRSKTIEAPAGYNGSPIAAVPGAKIKYKIVIHNQGLADSTTVNITELIHNHKEVVYFYNSPKTELAYATNSNVTSSTTTVNYSLESAPAVFDKNESNLSAGKYDPDVAAIRWSLSKLESNKYATLNYTVVIKQN
jgi:N-acetylneuraminic acid mutarotase